MSVLRQGFSCEKDCAWLMHIATIHGADGDNPPMYVKIVVSPKDVKGVLKGNTANFEIIEPSSEPPKVINKKPKKVKTDNAMKDKCDTAKKSKGKSEKESKQTCYDFKRLSNIFSTPDLVEDLKLHRTQPH